MKVRVLIPVLALTMLSLQGCLKEQEIASEKAVPQMTIRVSMPEDATKAGFTVPGSGEGLHLAWKAGDAIRVISGANSAVYTIQDGFTDHVASFTGPEVAGDSFDIVVPGTYASAAEAEAGDASLTQTGNGSTAHLVFTAKLTGVAKADLSEIAFTSDWVAAHAGTELKRGSIVKLTLTLPAALTAPKKVVLKGIGSDIAVNIENVDLTSEHVLTAYAQSGWDDVAITAGTKFSVDVFDADESRYAVTKTIESDATFRAGAQNIITVTDGFTEQLFAGGNGTQANPYLLANAKQLDNMHADGVLVQNEKKYFRLIKDIDMQTYLSSHSWIPLNYASPYCMAVNFDGGNHTISNFYVMRDTDNEDDFTNSAFFGVLFGECYDLTFYHAEARNESSTGGPTAVLAGYCGYDKNGQAAHVYNVHVTSGATDETKSKVVYGYTNSSIVSGVSSSCVGGLAGRIDNALIESCSFNGEVWSRRNYCGGLVGLDWGSGGIIRNCWVGGRVRGEQRIGGIIGGLIKRGSEIINCFSTANLEGARCQGAMVGHACLDSGTIGAPEDKSVRPENRIEGCINWASKQYTRTYSAEAGDYYSDGAIVGYTSIRNFLGRSLYRSDIDYRSYRDGISLVDQEDAGPSSPLATTNPTSATLKYHYPYNGKAFTGTLSNAAKYLGWSEVAWDLSGDTPVLTGVLDAAEIPSSGASSLPAGSRGEGPKRPVNGGNWHVETVADGITYYHYENSADSEYAASYNSHNNWHSGGDTHQNVFVVDVDLDNPAWKVKVVYTTEGVPCSDIFRASGAVAAINASFELGSIALKANSVYNVSSAPVAQSTGKYTASSGSFTEYPAGYAVSYMPNNTIDKSGVENWKSMGTVYFDGNRGVQMAFDGYDPSKGMGGDYNPPVKSISDERLFYRLCTGDKIAFISSAPVLIENYNTVGTEFHTSWYKGSWSDDSESAFVHQRSLYSRTAVALTEDNHLLLFVCDGKYPNATGGTGMSASWVTKFLHDNFNPQYALNLDGGGSTTMCVATTTEGDAITHVVNHPSENYTGKYKYKDGGKEKELKDIYDQYGERVRNNFIVIVPAK